MTRSTTSAGSDCGGVAGEGASLKACKSSMLVKYCNCNANCQRNHWPKHKIAVAWQKGALVSRHVSRVCSSGTATPIVRGITGRSIKKSAKNMPLKYMMRRCSRTQRPRRTVPSASYIADKIGMLYDPFTRDYILRTIADKELAIVRLRSNTIHVAEKVFV